MQEGTLLQYRLPAARAGCGAGQPETETDIMKIIVFHRENVKYFVGFLETRRVL